MQNSELYSIIRLRLGIVINPKSEDPLGYRRLADNRSLRLHARHRSLVTAWRQVFVEAGGHVPPRNIERLLRNTHIPVARANNRRLDLVVPGLNIYQGRSLFCDATCVTVITGRGAARPGCLTRDGGALRHVQRENNNTYPEVDRSGLGRLCCLSNEVFGRWGEDPIEIIPALAREKSRGLPRRIRRGVQLALQNRWWGIVGIAVQRAVVIAATRDVGEDLFDSLLEPTPNFADLPVFA